MTSPAPTYEELAQSNAQLQAEVARLQAQASAPSKTEQRTAAAKTGVKKVLAGIAAALTTPEAIKAEKYIAVTALTRAAILIPAAAIVIDFVVGLLGGPSVKP